MTARLPDAFRRIRLALAREPGHPEGSREHGYELVVPLDESGHIDATLWKSHRDNCRFRHFRPGAESEAGHVVHQPGGSWAFHTDIRGGDEDAAGYRFQHERFTLGEYVSIREGGVMHTYRVVSLAPVT